MRTTRRDAAPRPDPRPRPTAQEAEALIMDLSAVIAELTALIEQETALVRAARLGEAMRLRPRKDDLSRRYLSGASVIQANAAVFSRHLPEPSRELRRRLETFEPLLKSNLTVLATAHAVSEGIIRTAAAALARKAAPRTYGSSGRPTPPSGRIARPIAVSRSL